MSVKRIIHAALVLMCLFLSGCGVAYTVSVSSLSADVPVAETSPCFLESAMPDMTEDDLLFREVARMLRPAFAAKGLAVTEERAAARSLVRVAFRKEQPQIRLETGTVQRSKPVVVRDGKKERIEYVTVEEPTLSTRTIYSAVLRVEAFAVTQEGMGRQIWRTEATCAGPVDDLATLLERMAPVLPGLLGGQSRGLRRFEVCVDDNGKISVDETGEHDL